MTVRDTSTDGMRHSYLAAKPGERVGGDEFVALLPNLRQSGAAQIVAGKIMAAILSAPAAR